MTLNYKLLSQYSLCISKCVESRISGDTIYGRVMVDPVQNLGDSFFCSIEKVFLCTGADGYVPKYNPTKFEFGCLADSPSLLYRFKILVSMCRFLMLQLRCTDGCKET